MDSFMSIFSENQDLSQFYTSKNNKQKTKAKRLSKEENVEW